MALLPVLGWTVAVVRQDCQDGSASQRQIWDCAICFPAKAEEAVRRAYHTDSQVVSVFCAEPLSKDRVHDLGLFPYEIKQRQ